MTEQVRDLEVAGFHYGDPVNRPRRIVQGSPDESGGMTIDELLDDIDSALADHREPRVTDLSTLTIGDRMRLCPHEVPW